jgi:hypothetical protein
MLLVGVQWMSRKAPTERRDLLVPVPCPLPAAEIDRLRAANSLRFPSEPWWPPGFDVGPPAPSLTATVKELWASPALAAMPPQPRVWLETLTARGAAPRPPGALLLNLLVMNEGANLNRTLPVWANIIDYWVIGVDEKNSDDSIDIIKRYLGHLPGAILDVRRTRQTCIALRRWRRRM